MYACLCVCVCVYRATAQEAGCLGYGRAPRKVDRPSIIQVREREGGGRCGGMREGGRERERARSRVCASSADLTHLNGLPA